MCFNKVTVSQLKIYFTNFILCGELDYHCMLCKENFAKLHDIDSHIKQENHTSAKDAVHRYKETIFEIGPYYYCQLCNYAVMQIEEINLHLVKKVHMKIKNNPNFCGANKMVLDRPLPEYSDDNNSVKFDNFAITVENWHGIKDGYCTLCNLPVITDEKEHMTHTNHMINLVNCVTEVVPEKDKYQRYITKNVAYCFKCEVTIPIQLYKYHWKVKHAPILPKTPTPGPKKYFDVDTENYKATCKICKEVINYQFLRLYEHKKKHLPRDYVRDDDEYDQDLLPFYISDKGKTRKELKEYGKQHGILLNRGGSRGLCTLCCRFLSACRFNFKEHVNGKLHTAKLQAKSGTHTRA